jgi:GTPase SAR1 family protein
VLHYETSAKTGENIDQLFSELVTKAIEKQRKMGSLDHAIEGAPTTEIE